MRRNPSGEGHLARQCRYGAPACRTGGAAYRCRTGKTSSRCALITSVPHSLKDRHAFAYQDDTLFRTPIQCASVHGCATAGPQQAHQIKRLPQYLRNFARIPAYVSSLALSRLGPPGAAARGGAARAEEGRAGLQPRAVMLLINTRCQVARVCEERSNGVFIKALFNFLEN